MLMSYGVSQPSAWTLNARCMCRCSADRPITALKRHNRFGEYFVKRSRRSVGLNTSLKRALSSGRQQSTPTIVSIARCNSRPPLTSVGQCIPPRFDINAAIASTSIWPDRWGKGSKPPLDDIGGLTSFRIGSSPYRAAVAPCRSHLLPLSVGPIMGQSAQKTAFSRPRGRQHSILAINHSWRRWP